jgi:hypothetical protein
MIAQCWSGARSVDRRLPLARQSRPVQLVLLLQILLRLELLVRIRMLVQPVLLVQLSLLVQRTLPWLVQLLWPKVQLVLLILLVQWS